MPELPEVEVIRRSLNVVRGKRIAAVYFSSSAPVETTTPRAIRQTLLGRGVAALRRRGKYLLLEVDDGGRLVIHFGMTGRLLYAEQNRPRTKHTHMEIHFGDGSRLALIDPRRFGTISLSFRPDGSDNPFLRRLGLEYDDPTVTVEDYLARFRRHLKLALKTALLHQGIIAGLGNIYACEALYRARLDPRRKIAELDDAKLARLVGAIRKTLTLGIRWGGTTLRDYLNGRGARGQMQKFLQVYGLHFVRDGARRRRPVVRIIQQNRSTWFCPACQK